jgi:hypothetical protein
MPYYRDWENRLYYREMLMKLKICIFQNIQLLKIGKLQIFTHIMFFQSRIKSICGEIKFRENFKYKGKTVNVKHAFIGITNSSNLFIMRVEEKLLIQHVRTRL